MTQARAYAGVVARKTVLFALVAALAVVGTSCGDGDERPSDAAWQSDWATVSALVPTEQALIDGGRELCDVVLADLHEQTPALLPTPSELLDDPVRQWIEHAEAIAFECPIDNTEARTSRYHELSILSAEISAGLAADAEV